MQYDSLRYYIKSCAQNDDSFDAFSALSGAVQFMSDDTSRFEPYRNWLISVLYFNTTSPYYFCFCMDAIAGTFQHGKYRGIGTFTIEDYLRRDHRDCLGPNADTQYTTDSLDLLKHGYDVINLPPLDSLGLGSLLKNAVTPLSSGEFSSKALASFSSSPTPFHKETTLDFTLNHMSSITLAIYDELGRLVWEDGKGNSLEAGTHAIHLDGNSLPSGTLYARIATGFGEVKTVKLVHER